MKSKWRYRPGRQSPTERQPEKPAPEPSSLPSILKEVALLLSGTAGLFVAILWLAGRSYANGFFAAMNMPSLVTSSVWEYAELAWIPSLIGAAVLIGLIFITELSRRFLTWSIYFLLHMRIDKYLRIIWLFYIGVTFLWLYQLPGLMAKFGYDNGILAIQKGTPEIEIVTDRLQPLGTQPVVLSTANGESDPVYTYNGFRLIIYSNGKYYLYNDLDPATCRPKQVYVVSEDQCLQVNVLPISPLNSQCQDNSGQGSAPTLTPVTTVHP